jgi:predicted dehydrogenase
MAIKRKKVRYAVIGLGHIAQAAVLPAFAHAENSELTALVSDDPEKRRELSEKYGVERAIDYDDLEDLFERRDVDAVYITLPNHMHHEFVVRAASAAIHVLCEKPLGVSTKECEEMIAAAEAAGVKLMTAYRLHFEKANLKAIEIAKSGQLGELRIFNSVFDMQVKPDNVRLDQEAGGGTLYDIGIYCINAARNLFRDEPDAVQAWSVSGDDPRFKEVDETTSAILHFSDERLASFTCSFGTADVGHYQIVGTEGDLRLDPAYEYVGALKHFLTVGGKTTTRTFRARDQFAPELIYFSNCVLRNKTPEPSGEEGLADVRVIEALYKSAETGERVLLSSFERKTRPEPRQEIHRPKIREPELVKVDSPTGDS